MLYTCPNCNKQVKLSDSIKRFQCSCKQGLAKHPLHDEMLKCVGCKFRVTKGCALYFKPCLITKLWEGELDPPEGCPSADKF